MRETSELSDKIEIAELITRYATLHDSADWEAVADLYTEHAMMSRPTAPDEFVLGRASILEALLARPRRATRHVVANVLVSVHDKTHASATSQILLYVGAFATDGGLPLSPASAPLIGTYRDRLIRTDQGWRFTERRGSLDFRAPV